MLGEEIKCQLKSTCQRRPLSSRRVKSQTWARLHQGPRRKPRAVDQHIKLGAAAGVAAHRVVLVEIYLARVHHFPAWGGEAGLKEDSQRENIFECTVAEEC